MNYPKQKMLEYQQKYLQKHGEMSPFTVAARHPSQRAVYVPNALPLILNDESAVNKFVRTQESQELLDRIPNLRTIDASEVSSNESVSGRFVVPNVVNPNYEADILTGGNPYAHHEAYATPSQYFEHNAPSYANKIQRSNSEEQLTVFDIAELADPFTSDIDATNYPLPANAPNDVTLNKKLLSHSSMMDIDRLEVDFPMKGGVQMRVPVVESNSTPTLNKRMFSSNSIYDIKHLDVEFEQRDEMEPSTNLLKIQEFSPQSLEDLRQLKELSQYSGFHNYQDMTESKDVSTCLGISSFEADSFQTNEHALYGTY